MKNVSFQIIGQNRPIMDTLKISAILLKYPTFESAFFSPFLMGKPSTKLENVNLCSKMYFLNQNRLNEK